MNWNIEPYFASRILVLESAVFGTSATSVGQAAQHPTLQDSKAIFRLAPLRLRQPLLSNERDGRYTAPDILPPSPPHHLWTALRVNLHIRLTSRSFRDLLLASLRLHH